MGIFGPNIKKLVKNNDTQGLIRLLSHKNPDTRISGFLALTRSSDEAALDAMKKLLHDQDPRVRTVATLKFGEVKMEEMAENLGQILRHGTPADKIEALHLISSRGVSDSRLSGILIALLEDRNLFVQIAAIKTMGTLKDVHAVERLIGCLEHEHVHVRVEAIRSLGEIRDARTVNPIIGAYLDKNPEVRSAARGALERIGSKEALKALNDSQFIMLVKKMDGSEYERMETAAHIGRLGLKEALPLVINAAGDKFKEVRLTAAKSLGDLKEKEGIDALIKLLEDKFYDVRLEAVKALDHIPSPEALDALESAARDKNKSVKSAAEKAMKAMKARLGK